MKMSQLASACLLGTTLLASSLAAHAVPGPGDPNHAKINVTAKLVGSTCTADWQASTPEVLDLSSVSDLKTKGATHGDKPFILKVTHCDRSVTKVTVTATGEADTKDNAYFKNQALTDPAQNVAVSLLGGTSGTTVIKPNDSVDYTVNGNAADMKFSARLVATNVGATAGDVASKITLDMAYQ